MRTLFGGSRGVSSRSVSMQDVWGKGLDWDELARDPAVQQLAITATLACVDVKASTIASMPLQEFERVGDTRRPVASRSRLLDDPSELFSPEEWVYASVASATLWDETIGVVRSTGRNSWPLTVEWLVPSRVPVSVRSGRAVYLIDGREHSAFRHGGDVVHIRRRPVPGSANGGLSAAKALGPLIAIGVEGARALCASYLSGGLPLSALTWDGELAPGEADAVSEAYVAQRRKHLGRPLVKGRGWKFETFPRQDVTADLTAVRKQINTEIASAHNVPPELVGGESGNSMTYTSLEGLTRYLEVRTLLPVYVPLERALSRLLPDPRFCRFNADATIRTSLLDRMRSHDIAVRVGMRSVNDSRRIEDEEPIGDQGDRYLWPPYAASVQATTPNEESTR